MRSETKLEAEGANKPPPVLQYQPPLRGAEHKQPSGWLRLEFKESKMKKANVEIGNIYIVKVSGKLAKVKLAGFSPYGGWVGTNLATGREVRIKTAARLRSEVTT